MKILSRLFLLFLLVLPTTILITSNGNQRLVVGAQEDDGGDEDEEATVASEEEPTVPTDEEEFEEEVKIEPHPMADTTLLFTKFGGKGEIPAGKFIELLIGMSNGHDESFLIDTVDASFRYPMDYNYYIQNFSTVSYGVAVAPGQEASFYYGFVTNEYFAGRPFGLSVNLNYRGKDGKEYRDAVFNDTVQVVEVEEGIDGETFFLYMFFVAVAVLLAVAIQQLANMRKRRHTKSKVEVGTQNHSDVDYDWIPRETIAADSKRSPGKSPTGKKSPRQRRTTKRAKGAGDD